MISPPPISTRTDALCPVATLFRSQLRRGRGRDRGAAIRGVRGDIQSGAYRGAARPDSVRSGSGARHPSRGRLRLRGVPSTNGGRSEEHTSELQSLMRTSYTVFCLIKNIMMNL